MFVWGRRSPQQEQEIAEQRQAEQNDADHAEKKLEKVFLHGVKKQMDRGGLDQVLAQLDDLDDSTARKLLGWAASRETPEDAISAIGDRCSNISACSLEKLTPLQLAARVRNVPVIKQLLLMGAEVNTRSGDRSCTTALHLAVRTCCLDSVEALLADEDIEVDAADGDGETPLHYCAAAAAAPGKMGRAGEEGALADIAEVLMRRGANMHKGTRRHPRHTPLWVAIEANACALVERMLRRGDETPPRLARLYMSSFRELGEENEDMAKLLVEAGWGARAVGDDDAAATRVAAAIRDINKAVRPLRTVGESQQRPSGSRAPPSQSYPLHDAAKSGDLEALSKLLRSGEDVNAVDKNGATALHAAVMHGHNEVVDALLKAEGIVVDKPDNSKVTALYRAAIAEEAGAVKALIKAGASPHANKNGVTILMHMVKRPAGPVLEALLAGGALPPSGGKRGLTPLHIACEYDEPGTVEALLRAGALPGHCWNSALRSPLMIACARWKLNAVRQLLAKLSKRQINMRESKEKGAQTALSYALKRNSALNSDVVAIVEELLEAGADPNIAVGTVPLEHVTALPIAMSSPRIAKDSTFGPLVVKALVSGGANANEMLSPMGCSPLQLACYHGACGEVIQVLLDAGADATAPAPGLEFLPPLPMAAYMRGNAGAVKVLIDHPQTGGLNAVGGSEKDTALSAAVQGGKTEVVRYLLEEGADMDLLPWEDVKTPGKKSLIAIAAESGHLDVMNLLIQAKMFKDKAEHVAEQEAYGAGAKGAGKDAPR